MAGTGIALFVRPTLMAVPVRAARGLWGARLTTARAQLRQTLGPIGAWVVLCGAGLAVSVAVLWPLGRLALSLENAWDRPVFEWFRAHPAGAGWQRLNEVLTQLGNRPPIYAVAASAAIILVVFAPRRRWVPPALIVMAVLIEQYVRVGLLRVVDRGHPPTSDGTWPSGGVGRIIAIYGFVVFLTFWCARRRGLRVANGRTAIAAGGLIAVMVTVEGYTRLYLLKHWLTDVLGGYVFGGLLLAVFVYAGRALLDEDEEDEEDWEDEEETDDANAAGTANAGETPSAERRDGALPVNP
ncbi:MAG TPA: phosphatase PAP2 family protein [Streptosporangiaceae bacterium]|nr:phosphatase PAP2 family protein [Streptosporangiaceae bacterium]